MENPSVPAGTEGRLLPSSTAEPTGHHRQIRSSCPACAGQAEADLLRVGVGALACLLDGRPDDSRLLVGPPMCRPHGHGALAVALAVARAVDATTTRMLRQLDLTDLPDELDDLIRDEVLRRFTLDVALTGTTPRTDERTQP